MAHKHLMTIGMKTLTPQCWDYF